MKQFLLVLLLLAQSPLDLANRAKADIELLIQALTPPPMTVVDVPVGANLQATIDSAPAGTTIRLTAGGVYPGFTLSSKGGTVTTTGTLSSGRISPTDAPQLAIIKGLITTTNLSQGWVLSGLEVQSTGTTGNLVEFNEGAKNLTLDRCWLHGFGVQKRGVALNSGIAAVINSYISDIHIIGQDSQAIAAWAGPGPYLIVNNYLEAAGENFLTGGADPAPGIIPSDITFTDNVLAKPLAWRNQGWNVKNLFELKNARRVLATRNTLRGVWGEGQTGYAVQLTPRNQDGNCPQCTVEDVSFTHNSISQAAAAVNLLGADNLYPSQRMARVVISDNTFDVDPWLYGGSDKVIQVLAGPVDITVDHNLITGPHIGSILYFDGLPQALRLVFTNNSYPTSLYGIFGGGSSVGGNPPHAWTDYVSAGTFSGNVITP